MSHRQQEVTKYHSEITQTKNRLGEDYLIDNQKANSGIPMNTNHFNNDNYLQNNHREYGSYTHNYRSTQNQNNNIFDTFGIDHNERPNIQRNLQIDQANDKLKVSRMKSFHVRENQSQSQMSSQLYIINYLGEDDQQFLIKKKGQLSIVTILVRLFLIFQTHHYPIFLPFQNLDL